MIAGFYGDFHFTVNALTVVLQLLLVGRVFRWLGVAGAILVLPAFAVLGYGLLAFLPIFSLIHFVKVAENGINYSVMNTGAPRTVPSAVVPRTSTRARRPSTGSSGALVTWHRPLLFMRASIGSASAS